MLIHLFKQSLSSHYMAGGWETLLNKIDGNSCPGKASILEYGTYISLKMKNCDTGILRKWREMGQRSKFLSTTVKNPQIRKNVKNNSIFKGKK